MKRRNGRRKSPVHRDFSKPVLTSQLKQENEMANEIYAAILANDNWVHDRVIMSMDEVSCETRAIALLMELTREHRDFDEFPDDEEWLAICYEDGWAISTGIVIETV